MCRREGKSCYQCLYTLKELLYELLCLSVLNKSKMGVVFVRLFKGRSFAFECVVVHYRTNIERTSLVAKYIIITCSDPRGHKRRAAA